MTPYPKIELHVHLEGAVRVQTLKQIAKRNDYPLPDDLDELYRFRDFRHFIEVWILTTNALQTAEDFRQMVVDYAAEAASHGAVYLEGIFSSALRSACVAACRGRSPTRACAMVRKRRASCTASRCG
jgi:aminodeoxyfutalosine deaminase